MGRASDRTEFEDALKRARTGVRVMLVGGQYDVLTALAIARDSGLIPEEITSFVVDTEDLPVYCAHRRITFRAEAAPTDLLRCA